VCVCVYGQNMPLALKSREILDRVESNLNRVIFDDLKKNYN